MTTAARHNEADAATLAFQAALTELGVSTIEDALAMWEAVPPGRNADASQTWLSRVTQLVMLRHRRARDIARAYYRLVRALHTGTTMALPGKSEPATISIDVLREEFRQFASAPESPALSARPQDTSSAPEAGSGAPEGLADSDELDRILVEELQRIEEDAARLEAEAEEEIRIALEALGPVNQERLIEASDGSQEARDLAHLAAGARQAAAAERVVMDGARNTVWNVASRDKRAIGYARRSSTGQPCGWCAMLISRGAVYRSESSATYGEDGDKYHDNCHCYAVPVFTREQYGSSTLFELNRRYGDLWPQVTRGLSGKSALSAWRRFIREEQKASRAQAARTQTTAQEA